MRAGATVQFMADNLTLALGWLSTINPQLYSHNRITCIILHKFLSCNILNFYEHAIPLRMQKTPKKLVNI